MDADESRVVLGAEPEAFVGIRRIQGGGLDRFDEVGAVHPREKGVEIGFVVDTDHFDAGQVEHAERACQPGGEVQPDRVHRVRFPEVVLGESVIPDDSDRRRCRCHGRLRLLRVGGVPAPATKDQSRTDDGTEDGSSPRG